MLKATHTLFMLAIFSFTASSQEWKNYTHCLRVGGAVAQQDTVWVATQGGVAKYLSNGTRLATYTHADGLADNRVTGIAVDSSGNKWFASGVNTGSGNIGGGVSKFDGTSWIVWDTSNSAISSSYIEGIAIDRLNNIWVSTYTKGVAKFDGVNWTNYNSLNSVLPSDFVGGPIADKLGTIWFRCFNSSSAFVKIDGNNWSVFNLNLYGSMAFDNQNNLWFARPNSSGGYPPVYYPAQIVKYDGTNITTYTSSNFGSLSPNSVAIDAQGNKWFGGDNKLCRFDGSTWTIYNVLDSGTLVSLNGALVIDNSGNKWYGTKVNAYDGSLAAGLGRFDGVNWTILNPSPYKLPGNQSSVVGTDKRNNIWISSFTGFQSCTGIRYDGINWDTICPPGASSIGPVATDNNGNMWIGSSDAGPYYFDGTNWTNYSLALSYPQDIVVDRHNNVWLGHYLDGVSKYNGSSWVNWNESNSGIADDYVPNLAIDKQDNKWFCGRYGVTKYDGTNWITYSTSNSDLPHNQVNDVAIDGAGNKWFATDSGVSKFDGINWITYNTTNSGLGGNTVWRIAADKHDNIWCSVESQPGYKKGVSKFNGHSWSTYNTFNSGLGDNNVSSIVVDDYNNIWFGSEGGISELIGADTLTAAWNDSVFSVWLDQTNPNLCSNNLAAFIPTVHLGSPPYTFSWETIGDSLSCSSCVNPTSSITQNSVFIVKVTDNTHHVATDTLHLYACINTSLLDLNSQTSLVVFPNPTQNSWHIIIDGNLLGGTVDITDVNGKIVFTSVVNQSLSIISPEISNGVYFLRFKSGDKTLFRKLVRW